MLSILLKSTIMVLSECFAMVLLDFSSVSNAYPNAPSTIPTVAPYKPFCLFLPCFFSVLLLHSGHISKLQFFHCFSIVSRVLYAIMVPPSILLGIILPSPYSFHRFASRINFPSVLLKFSIAFPCFSIVLYHSLSFFPLFFSSFSPPFPFFPIVLCHIPSFFLCFSHHFPSFSPPSPFFPHCFISYSLIFSIVFLIIFPSIAISPSPPRRADQGGIDTPPSPNCHLVHNPKKLYLWPPFLPPNFPIFGHLGALCPQTPLTHFVRKKNFA